ncbi:MAG TPA: PP2C family serine/threonine-protein phosphatase, partial [Coleofasciculaceae cyanobacterium]
MSHPPVQIQCANPDCLHADNPLGQAVCDRCQTPLLYRYLWALDAAHIPVDTMVADRYWVVRPQVWLDTQPGQGADVPTLMPNSMLPYLQLYGQRLHTPGLYGFCAEAEDTAAIALLDNAPIDSTGQLLPNLATVWQSTAPARQLYWLWQILQLWQPLQGLEVARSLLIPENLHVEGWRVRLRELTSDRPPSPGAEMETEAPADSDSSPDAEGSGLPLLKDLGNLWLAWVDTASAAIAAPLRHLCEQMQTVEETALEAIAAQLNALLLEQVAQLPLQVESVGATTTGPQRTHNEDACFPDESTQADPLIPYVGIICDGIGGHEGGEVASQLALRSLKLQTRALLAELLEQAEPLSPTVVAQQLTGMVRVVNNLIAAQNDSQGRALRQRMGTTLVMALQLPQPLPNQGGNAHELYLVHVGDSRAYWITPEYCHQLTVDDDVVTREVVMGRSPYQEAIRRPDGGALIQALGTRGSELLDINVQ